MVSTATDNKKNWKCCYESKHRDDAKFSDERVLPTNPVDIAIIATLV